MNTTLFDNLLANGLGDASGVVYTQSARQAATVAAALAYSQYFPFLREFGTGSLVGSIDAAVTELVAIGGVFTTGQSLVINPGSPISETIAIESVEPNTAGESTGLSKITLTSATQYPHTSGAYLAMAQVGLPLVVGQTSYAMPFDFYKPDARSFDRAIGGDGRYRTESGEGYFDLLYGDWGAANGLGAGYAANYGYGAIPVLPPGGRFASGFGSAGAAQRYHFVLGEQPVLIIEPAPVNARTLYFRYLGMHTPSTVPQAESEALLGYARYSALSARAAYLSQQADVVEFGDQKWNAAAAIKSLNESAEAALTQFNDRIRNRPYATTG